MALAVRRGTRKLRVCVNVCVWRAVLVQGVDGRHNVCAVATGRCRGRRHHQRTIAAGDTSHTAVTHNGRRLPNMRWARTPHARSRSELSSMQSAPSTPQHHAPQRTVRLTHSKFAGSRAKP